MGNQQIDFIIWKKNFETSKKQLFRAALLKARKLILATEETNKKNLRSASGLPKKLTSLCAF